jgi:hypothetical protein
MACNPPTRPHAWCVPPLADGSQRGGGSQVDEDMIWAQGGFPSYLQNSSQGYSMEVCRDFDRAITEAERSHSINILRSIEADEDDVPYGQAVWQAIR